MKVQWHRKFNFSGGHQLLGIIIIYIYMYYIIILKYNYIYNMHIMPAIILPYKLKDTRFFQIKIHIQKINTFPK